MQNLIPNPPAIVRSLDELSELATRINQQHEMGERSAMQGMEHCRLAGEWLIQAKKRCGHGRFLKWLEDNVRFDRTTASRYMKLATNWVKCCSVQHLTEAYKILASDDQDDNLAPHHNTVGTGNEEWYTPLEYCHAARDVLRGIDLDPASCSAAQQNVRAATYYTKEDDGLTKAWHGKVFMNPPYTDGLIEKFTDKLVKHYTDVDVTEAIVLTHNCTDTKWFARLAAVASCFCFPEGRIKFLSTDPKNEKKSGTTQGQVFTYLGPNEKNFCDVFSRFGLTLVKGSSEQT